MSSSLDLVDALDPPSFFFSPFFFFSSAQFEAAALEGDLGDAIDAETHGGPQRLKGECMLTDFLKAGTELDWNAELHRGAPARDPYGRYA
jgi:hypothetical protein